MKKPTIVLLVLLLSLANINAQQTSVKTAFLEKWENSKNYLIEIAEAMPEDVYDFKPTERQMSFKEQLMHIKGNMEWLSTTYFTELKYEKSESLMVMNKVETIIELEKGFDKVIKIIEKTADEDLKETVEFFAGPKSKLQILNLMQDHVTHHRGQLIVYLNLNEIDPPKYIGW